MARIRIPELYRTGLRQISTISDDEFDNLMTTLVLNRKPDRENWYNRISPIGIIPWRRDSYERWEVLEDEEPEKPPVDYGVNSLLHRFSATSRAELETYLEAHPGLLQILFEAADQLNARFPQSELELKVVRYPEADNYQQLFVYIKTDFPVSEALAILESFDAEWFLDADTYSNHSFNVKLRYV